VDPRFCGYIDFSSGRYCEYCSKIYGLSQWKDLRKPPEGDLYARKQRGKDLGNSLGLSRNRKRGDGYIAIDYLNKTETGRRPGLTDKRPNGQQQPSMQEGQGQREG
jgi:hypothetical protein